MTFCLAYVFRVLLVGPLDEMNRLNFTLGDHILEEYIYDYVVTNREEDFITKIMFKLTSKHFYTNL